MINYLLCRWVHRNKLLTRQMTNKKVFWQLHEEMVTCISTESEQSLFFLLFFFQQLLQTNTFLTDKTLLREKNLYSLDFSNASELRKDTSKTHFLK